jgi:hypothetical protein
MKTLDVGFPRWHAICGGALVCGLVAVFSASSATAITLNAQSDLVDALSILRLVEVQNLGFRGFDPDVVPERVTHGPTAISMGYITVRNRAAPRLATAAWQAALREISTTGNGNGIQHADAQSNVGGGNPGGGGGGAGGGGNAGGGGAGGGAPGGGSPGGGTGNGGGSPGGGTPTVSAVPLPPALPLLAIACLGLLTLTKGSRRKNRREDKDETW